MPNDELRHKLRLTEEMETGDEVVDEQHRSMFALLNELLDAEGESEKDDLVPAVLDRLVLHTVTHFAAEEELMKASGFPQSKFDAHVTQHRELTERTRQLVLDYRVGKVPTIAPVVEFLRSWLGEHIDQLDRLLVEHVREERGSR